MKSAKRQHLPTHQWPSSRGKGIKQIRKRQNQPNARLVTKVHHYNCSCVRISPSRSKPVRWINLKRAGMWFCRYVGFSLNPPETTKQRQCSLLSDRWIQFNCNGSERFFSSFFCSHYLFHTHNISRLADSERKRDLAERNHSPFIHADRKQREIITFWKWKKATPPTAIPVVDAGS